MQVFLGVAQFVVVVVASIIIGVVVGMVGAFFTRFTEHVHGEWELSLLGEHVFGEHVSSECTCIILYSMCQKSFP